jgi:hypothetical protein
MYSTLKRVFVLLALIILPAAVFGQQNLFYNTVVKTNDDGLITSVVTTGRDGKVEITFSPTDLRMYDAKGESHTKVGVSIKVFDAKGILVNSVTQENSGFSPGTETDIKICNVKLVKLGQFPNMIDVSSPEKGDLYVTQTAHDGKYRLLIYQTSIFQPRVSYSYEYTFNKDGEFVLKEAITHSSTQVTTEYTPLIKTKPYAPYKVSTLPDEKIQTEATYFPDGNIATFSVYNKENLVAIKDRTTVEYYPGTEHRIAKIEYFVPPVNDASSLVKQFLYSNDELSKVNKISEFSKNTVGETTSASVYEITSNGTVTENQFERATMKGHFVSNLHLLHFEDHNSDEIPADISAKISSAQLHSDVPTPDAYGYKLDYKPADKDMFTLKNRMAEEIKKDFITKYNITGKDEKAVNTKIIETVLGSNSLAQEGFDILFKTGLITQYANSYKATKDPSDALCLLVLRKVWQKYVDYSNTATGIDPKAADLALRYDIEDMDLGYSDKIYSPVKELKDVIKDVEVGKLDINTLESKEDFEKKIDLMKIEVE